MSGARGAIRVMAADWFERLTGFREEGYELTRSRFVVDGEELVSTHAFEPIRRRHHGFGPI